MELMNVHLSFSLQIFNRHGPVWRKLQGIGTEIVSLAKSLSDMSRTSCHEQVGGLVHSTCEDGKHEFFPRNLIPTQNRIKQKIVVCTKFALASDAEERQMEGIV